ncbi:hypothetical protein [Neisseria iguanae]|nr:hypothetical protein [Neisseria iguanae]
MVNWWNQVVTPADKDAVQIREASKTDDDLSRHIAVEKIIAPVKGLVILSPADANETLSVTVNDHSLGGHLAGAFARLF